MDELGTYASVTTDDMTVESNTESAEAMSANFAGVTAEEAATGLPAATDQPAVADAAEAAPVKPATDDAVPESTARNADGTFKAKPKARDNPIARMQDATAKEAAAKRERDEARAETARVQAELAALKAPKPAAVAEPAKPTPEAEWKRYRALPNAPQVTQFESYDDYTAALSLFIADARYDERTTADRQRSAHETQVQTWKQRLATFKAATPDWDARFKPDTPIDHRVFPYLTAQEDGPQVLLYLSDHPDLAQRLATLHPIDQIGELGKIQARLEAALKPTGPAPQTPMPSSQAKAPITPVTASPAVADPDDDASDDEPVEKFFARENARERKVGRR